MRSNIKLILPLAGFIAASALVAPWTYAGGPLAIVDGQPVRWSRTEVLGGTLNSATVDASGRVLYHVDTGKLGSLTEAQATALVDRIFKEYTDIPTNQPVNVDGSNAGAFLNTQNPTFQNPIIFDSDGSITGSGGILGFFAVLHLDQPSASLREGVVVLNGRALSSGSIGTASFVGVFTHEFGHFAGPLDHAQINGNIASNGKDSILPTGFDAAQAYDLYAPFTETMFPWIFDAPPRSQLASQFEDSGFFIATLDLDTQNALSNLYPSEDYLSSRGSVEGRVLMRTESGDIPVTGINVVARKLSEGGGFPPALGTQAFPVPPILDGDGVPSIPPDQSATDSLKFVSSAVTGLEFGAGAYRIQGLPPGDYLVQIDRINTDAIGASGIGPVESPIPIPENEFYNGANESATDNPTHFVPVTVTGGNVTGGIDIILNGFSSAPFISVAEVEPNENKKKAPRIEIPSLVTASVAATDASLLRMNIGAGETDRIEDLYLFTVSAAGTYFIFLESTSGSGDLDLYLFTSGVAKKNTSLSDPNLLGIGASPSSTEAIAAELLPGKYIIGVSAFQGRQNYRLLLIPPQ
jgi:hypothetical protein